MNNKRGQMVVSAVAYWVTLLGLLMLTTADGMAQAQEEQMYRTGLQAKRVDIAVSPEGRHVIIDTHQLGEPLKILDLSSGKLSSLAFTGQWPRWSPDGRHIALIWTETSGNRENLDNSQIQIVDAKTRQVQTLTTGPGLRYSPFFSSDSKTIYYFKGKVRESGKTPASNYDLYGISVSGGQESLLTEERFYQAAGGQDDGRTIVFSAIGGLGRHKFIDLKDRLGHSIQTLFLYEKSTGDVRPIALNQSGGVFQLRSPKRDQAGRLHFIAAKERPGGGHFLWFLVRTEANGTHPVLLKELPISTNFDIAQQSGEVYVADQLDGELVIRRMASIPSQ